MTTTDYTHPTEASGQILRADTTIDKFERYLAAMWPAQLPRTLAPDTALDELSAGGLTRAALLSAISRAGRGLDRQLLSTITTVGEACGWIESRWDAVPADLLAATANDVDPDAVRLRPVLPRDIELMYTAATSPERGQRWRFRGETPSFEHFQAQMWNNQRCHFIAEAGERPFAYFAGYDLSLKSRHCYLAILSLSGRPTEGRVFLGSFLFIEHLFRSFELRKLYIEVAGYNLDAVLGGPQTLFDIEGVLREHEEWHGQLWDNYIGAVSRERWDTFARNWRAWCGGTPDPLLNP